MNLPTPDYKYHQHQQGLWEYRLLANPDEGVARKVNAEKEFFENQYATEVGALTIPHITIAGFLLKERMEDLLCKQLQNICNLKYAFAVMLNNFSGFPSHAIFIRVQNAQPFKELAEHLTRLNDFFKTNECPPLQLASRPHMAIAGPLTEETYNKAITDYAQRDFNEVFVVNQLTLLKRDSRYKKWQHVTHLYLPAERNLFN